MNNTPLVLAMCRYEQDCMERVNHFLKVYAYARTIGEGEGLDELTQQILETAAIVHDIGIRPVWRSTAAGQGSIRSWKDRRLHGNCWALWDMRIK